MPRKSRIDAPGALHHIIARGIERTAIFADDSDRHHFIDRLGTILLETQSSCFAWALIPNHFYLLLKTGQGKRKDLTGGGLIRSSGGWTAVKAMRRA